MLLSCSSYFESNLIFTENDLYFESNENDLNVKEYFNEFYLDEELQDKNKKLSFVYNYINFLSQAWNNNTETNFNKEIVMNLIKNIKNNSLSMFLYKSCLLINESNHMPNYTKKFASEVISYYSNNEASTNNLTDYEGDNNVVIFWTGIDNENCSIEEIKELRETDWFDTESFEYKAFAEHPQELTVYTPDDIIAQFIDFCFQIYTNGMYCLQDYGYMSIAPQEFKKCLYKLIDENLDIALTFIFKFKNLVQTKNTARMFTFRGESYLHLVIKYIGIVERYICENHRSEYQVFNMEYKLKK